MFLAPASPQRLSFLMKDHTPADLQFSIRSLHRWQGPESLNRDSRIPYLCSPLLPLNTLCCYLHQSRPFEQDLLPFLCHRHPFHYRHQQDQCSTREKKQSRVARGIRPQLKCTSVQGVANPPKVTKNTKKKNYCESSKSSTSKNLLGQTFENFADFK